jgi:hypothetical protein
MWRQTLSLPSSRTPGSFRGGRQRLPTRLRPIPRIVVMTLPVAGGANVEVVTSVLIQELKQLVALSEMASS